jgi:hypothetical protein
MNRPTSDSPKSPGAGVIRALLFVAIGFSAGTLSAEGTSSHTRDAARQKIAAMTEAERARLNSDYQKFGNLPETERKKLHQLNAELKADPDLRRVMQEYLDFVEPLSPGEREDLHREPDPARRAALVRTKMKEQKDRAESWTRRGRSRRGLGAADLEKVLEIVETHLRKKGLTPSQAESLEGKSGLARQIAVFNLAIGRTPGEERPPSFGDLLMQPPVFEEMTAVISDPEQRKQVRNGIPRDRILLVRLIYDGLWNELVQKPKEDVLDEFFLKLTGVQQGEIMRLPVDQQQRALLRAYAEAHPEQIPAPPSSPRWMFGDRGGRRGSREGRNPGGENFRGPRRGEPGLDGAPPLPPERFRDRPPNGRPKADKPVN